MKLSDDGEILTFKNFIGISGASYLPEIFDMSPNPEFLHVRYERFRAAG